MTSWRDPHETVERVAAHVKSAPDERFLGALNDLLARADWTAEARSNGAAAEPIVYLVGAPRSGTTLLSQLVSKHTDMGYVNNLIARFWLRPAVGIRLSQICLGADARRAISFTSSYGTTPEIVGPHEFGYFWRHWLPLDAAPTHHLADDRLATVDVGGLRQALEVEILSTFGGPVVFKNVICGFHAHFLSQVHPSSLFVHITRDPVATASSVLHSRMARYRTHDAWWSLKPAALDQVLVPGRPAEEVARQVDHCRREIEAELQRPGVHGLTVRYEDLCADPASQLRRIVDATAALGGTARLDDQLIAALASSAGPTVAADHRAQIERYFARFGGSHT